MKIYVVVKGGLADSGNHMMATTEVAFSTKEKAQEYIKSLPAVWEEKTPTGTYFCERVIHETEYE